MGTPSSTDCIIISFNRNPISTPHTKGNTIRESEVYSGKILREMYKKSWRKDRVKNRPQPVRTAQPGCTEAAPRPGCELEPIIDNRQPSTLPTPSIFFGYLQSARPYFISEELESWTAASKRRRQEGSGPALHAPQDSPHYGW